MELSKQVCSLELSKKMKELGFKQDSLFYWFKNYFPDGYLEEGEWQLVYGKPKFQEDNSHILEEDIISAYTVAELGEMLPIMVNGSYGYYLEIGKDSKGWFICYSNENGTGNGVNMIYANTEADARAKMLIYLKENKLI